MQDVVDGRMQALLPNDGFALGAYCVLQFATERVISQVAVNVDRHGDAHQPATKVPASPIRTVPEVDMRNGLWVTEVRCFIPICVQRLATVPSSASQWAHLQMTGPMVDDREGEASSSR